MLTILHVVDIAGYTGKDWILVLPTQPQARRPTDEQPVK
jgi:hypothetical protein